jgi:outer membrane autotransporter protein
MMNRQILKKNTDSVGIQVCFALNRKWLIFLAILLAATELRAQSWNVVTGNWFVGENWTPPTVPTGTSVATVANGGTAVIAEGTASAGELTIGSTSTIVVGAVGTLNINTSVLNSGRIISLGVGLSLQAGASAINNATGFIAASAPATGAFTEGVLVSGNGAKIANAGLISGENGIVFNAGGSITNMAGVIQGVSRNDNGFNSQTGSGIYAFANSTLVSVVNEAGAKIQGVGTDSWGIHTGFAPINITNFGIISGTVNAINVNGGGTFINEPGASVTSTTFQPVAVTGGTENIINFGTISSSFGGIGFGPPGGGGSVTNNAGGVIGGTGPNSFGIASGSTNQSITVINSGAIFGSSGIDLGSGGGSITNNATGSITGGGSGHSAILGGTGGISISNAGTINGAVNLGNAANTVTLVTGGRINGDLNLGPNAASSLVLDGSGQEALSQAVTGAVTNAGSLTKQGAGTWTLDEELNAPISTNVLAGVLVVDSTLNTPVVNVQAGGLLAGSGTITGNVTNSGVLSPGTSPGTLTINGNYTQNAAGTLRIEIAGLAPSAHDLLAVSGHATLAGTLQLIGLGNFRLNVGDQLTFLTAKGGVSGSFGTIQNEIATGTIVKAQVVTLSDAVVLEGVQGSFLQAACNPNSAAVAKTLDSAVGDPRASTLIAFLDTEPFDKLCGDFTLIGPEALASIFNIGISLANVQTANLTRRLEDLRAGSTGFSSAGFTLNGSPLSLSSGFAGVKGPEGKNGPSVMAPTPENRWGVWVTGVGEFTNVDSTRIAAGYDLQTGGFTLGVDYRVSSVFAIGLTAGYAHTNANLANGGDLDVNSGTLGLYATAFSDGFYLDTAVTGGPSGYDSHRAALLGSANGNTDGGNLSVLVAAGYDWKKGGLSIGPTANFQFTYVDVGGFTESGSIAPLKIQSQNVESERTAFGMKASYEWKIGRVVVKPEISLAWQHEFGDQSYSIVSGFANGAGNSFTVTSPQVGRDSLLIGAGAAVLLSDRVSVYAYYDGELLRSHYESNNVSAGVRMTF